MKRGGFRFAGAWMMALLLCGVAGGQAPARAEAADAASAPAKEPATDLDYEAIVRSLNEGHWSERCMAALDAARFQDTKLLLHLIRRFGEEKDARVKCCIVQSLATWDGTTIMTYCSEELLESQAGILSKAENLAEQQAAAALLGKVVDAKPGTEPPAVFKAWQSMKAKWEKRQTEAAEAWSKTHGEKLQLSENDKPSPKAERVLLDFVKRAKDLESNGLEVALLLDDMGNMDGVNGDIKKASVAILGAWKALAPKAKIGIVTYNSDGVNLKQEPEEDTDKVDLFIQRIGGGGSGGVFSQVQRGLAWAIGKFKWNRKSNLHMFLIGGNPVQQVEQADAIAKIGLAVNTGFTIHVFGLNAGSNVSPRIVEGFDGYGQSGGGLVETILADTPVARLMVTAVFGKDDPIRAAPFAQFLLDYHTPLKKKK